MGNWGLTMADVQIVAMTMRDYAEVAALWERTEGVGLDEDSDCAEKTRLYLERNPGLSFVARVEGEVVGAVLCGHDGRRGYLHHLAVGHSRRRAGIGRMLVERCLAGLRSVGIPKCNIFVFGENEAGNAFWRATGWVGRDDLFLMQKLTDPEAKAGTSRSC